MRAMLMMLLCSGCCELKKKSRNIVRRRPPTPLTLSTTNRLNIEAQADRATPSSSVLIRWRARERLLAALYNNDTWRPQIERPCTLSTT
jgi:hypothetical protein